MAATLTPPAANGAPAKSADNAREASCRPRPPPCIAAV
jgi:hypothetical protein